jgi:hypothetical protein
MLRSIILNLSLLPTRTPGACIIKLITAIIYGFRDKLDCLSLNTRLGWKGWPGTNTVLRRGLMIQAPGSILICTNANHGNTTSFTPAQWSLSTKELQGRRFELTRERDFVLPPDDVGVLEAELSVEIGRVQRDGGVLGDVPHLKQNFKINFEAMVWLHSSRVWLVIKYLTGLKVSILILPIKGNKLSSGRFKIISLHLVVSGNNHKVNNNHIIP